MSYNIIVNENINDLSSKLGTENFSLKIVRFVIASSKSVIKTLPQAITSALRPFYRQIEPYNNKCRFFPGVESFSVIQSNKQVLRTTNKLNSRDVVYILN